MSEIEIRIVELPPMRVACAWAYGASPEWDAWQKLCNWANPKGLLDNLEDHPVFGFNNPGPSAEQAEYGYEFWIRVGSGAVSDGEIIVKDFEGGLFAVTACRLMGSPNVTEAWKLLWAWAQNSDYRWRQTHELEKPRNPLAPVEDMVLDLYLPIEANTSAAVPGLSS